MEDWKCPNCGGNDMVVECFATVMVSTADEEEVVEVISDSHRFNKGCYFFCRNCDHQGSAPEITDFDGTLEDEITPRNAHIELDKMVVRIEKLADALGKMNLSADAHDKLGAKIGRAVEALNNLADEYEEMGR